MNTLRLILNIANNSKISIKESFAGNNRINNVGDSLEEYIKESFANIKKSDSYKERMLKINKTFLYVGNSSNPPDMILRAGDAIEIKKLQLERSYISLNSSFPKSELLITDKAITKSCRDSEKWEKKDMLYIIGHVYDLKLKSLFLIYGNCFIADASYYQKVKDTISCAINDITITKNCKTKELARMKKIDPLNITTLRVRNMWAMKNPHVIFQDLLSNIKSDAFKIIAMVRDDKYHLLPENDRKLIEMSDNIFIQDKLIQNPNNPADILNCKLIHYSL